MRANFAVWILLAAAGIAACGRSVAQTRQQRDWCDDVKGTLDQTIEGCTALVQSGRLAGRDLSNVIFICGVNYSVKGDQDRAWTAPFRT